MNMKLQITSKHIQINKAQKTMLVVTVAATVITVFSVIISRTLLAQARFQSHVISARHEATKQLKENVEAARTLASQYNQVFEGSSPTNVIGGVNDPSPEAVPPNGDNGRLVLNALPTAYDYPALLTSVSKLLAQDGIGTPSIGGSDQSSTVDNSPSPNPKVLNIDLSVSGTATYNGVQSLIKDFGRSIRPYDITKLSLNGSESSMSVSINLTTYYQQAKTLKLKTKEVR
jgi:hypothetical protein